MNKRILAFVLALIMLVINVNITLAEELSWSEQLMNSNGVGGMPFAPADNYISMQNSPSFLWPREGDSYDFIICADYELKNVLYRVDGLKNNYYTFPHTLEAGRDMYWSVRFKKNGKLSSWSTPRKLIIDENAYEFLLPSVEEIMEKVPKEHPRLYATKETLDKVRAYRESSPAARRIFEHFRSKADAMIADGNIPGEPVYEHQDNYTDTGSAMQKLRADSAKVLDIIYTCGFVYLITGERKYGDFAADALLEVSSWDPKGVTSFAMQDQVCREIAHRASFGYDWCYNLLTEAEKAKVEAMILARMDQMDQYIEELKKSPYDSHGWTTVGYMSIVALGMYGDIPDAEMWLREILPLYACLLPPWSYEDGGWSQGTYYWSASTELSRELPDAALLGGIYNLYEKTWQRNETANFLYSYPHGSVGSWGDSSNVSEITPIAAHQTSKIAAVLNDGYAKWYNEETDEVFSVVDYFFAPDYEKVEVKSPYELELSKHFKDVGWVSMNSSLVDENRIACYFKSSPYGSGSHSEADQNSFIIQAFGENLAIKSGYYDSYHSRHNSGFTRKTYAHNSVTVDGGKGQVDDNMYAKGKITSFINSTEFDMCTGDASDAYTSNRIDKFTRTVIYIRPDQFIVIDDLKAPDGKVSAFEWWLNAADKISAYEDGNGARIEKGNAVLDAKLHYPENTKTFYTDLFSGPTLEHIAPGGGMSNHKVHKRLWFETERVNTTKFIVTMDAHRKEDGSKFVKSESFDDYMRLSFEDGTVALINLSANETTVETKDGISFKGEAVVYNDEEIMLANGTFLSVNGKAVFESGKTASVAIGRKEFSVSSSEDNKIMLHTGNEYTGKQPEFINNGVAHDYYTGVKSFSESDGIISAEFIKGDYKFSNGKKIAGEKLGKAVVEIIVDGKTRKAELDAFRQADGSVSACGKADIVPGKYIVKDKNRELNFMGAYKGAQLTLDDIYMSTSELNGNRIVLESVPSVNLVSEQLENPDELKKEMVAFVEAESYDSVIDGSVYTTRSFLSGGAGVTNMNGLGNKADYTISVPEAGYYDIYINYVSWEAGGKSVKGINLGGSYFITELPFTASYGSEPSEWRVLKTPTKVYLEAGENTFSIEPVSGLWNYDWIGLKKSNK